MIRRMLMPMMIALLVAGCAAAAKPAAPDPVAELLARYGWKPSGPRIESRIQLPADFGLQSGSFPWRIVVDLSLDVGLDPQPLAGQEVRLINLPVDDVQGGRLEDLKRHVNFRAYILLHPQTGRPAGAYLIQTGKNGEELAGSPGPSLSGRDLEEITGLSWPEYMQKFRGFTPPSAALEAEKPRIAIRQYFRAASAHDCDQLWSLPTEETRAGSAQQAWCADYEHLISIRVAVAARSSKTGFVLTEGADRAS